MSRTPAPIVAELDFVIEQVDERGEREEILAASSDEDIGRAAYDKAVETREGQRIMLRQRARVIARSWNADD